ncbi:MAG: cytochrome c-type biogenesis protein CcmH [Paracoccaceae bacterium]|jgi:cytochrome c-type biogenesis protein CcmH|nr:cytochrome c-type biogenesis protein CcmH [Marinovum sp.]MBT6098261.1 cytochrome c-type biogenesis protein CcmH [Marinovum sp.]MBT7907921.1 cytochrome c-type biogenesis protein CcmH [Marinovum sp.]MDG1425048.1 cytochrome c-type biogenesis protein CcmH [Paracoccaceae bacterium]
MIRSVLFVLILLLATPGWAVEPDEILPDAELEKRARDISQNLRCLVCQNESIDESTASLARDLRLLVRERLKQGETDQEVVAFVVDRYGEFVLLRPQANGINLILWALAPMALLFSMAFSGAYIRNKNRATKLKKTPPLSNEEKDKLNQILKR